MIHSLHIRNYKSHKRTEIEFKPGVNVLIGESDAGKSALMQAMGWIIFNRPVGDNFRSKWGGETSASIVINNNCITRWKGTENGYSIGSIKSTDYQEFKAFKNNIPEEVQAALNLNEINIKSQFDSHYLLSKSAGEVAQHFNKIAHLDKIDVGIAYLSSKIRQINSDINSEEKALQNNLQELKSFINIECLERKIKKVESLQISLQNKDSLIEGINKNIKLIQAVDIEISDSSKILELEPVIIELIEMDTLINSKKERVNSITYLIQKYNKLIIEEKECASVLDSETLVNELLGKVELLKETEERRTGLFAKITKLEEVTVNISKVQTMVNEKQELFDSKIIGKPCPLCGAIKKKKK